MRGHVGTVKGKLVDSVRVRFHFLDWSKKSWVDALFCCFIFSLAMWIGMIATRSGPGLTADSATYISMARNLYHGNGFVTDIVGPLSPSQVVPVTVFPPGYSLLIALLFLFGLPAIEAARFVSLISFAILCVTVYWIGLMLQGRACAILSCATTLVLPPVLRLATFALSDITFTAISALYIGAITRSIQIQKKQMRWLLLSAFFVALSTLVRFYGLIWIFTGVLVILTLHSLRLKQRITMSFAFVSISIIPTVILFTRSWMISRQVSGIDRGQGYHLDLKGNILLLFKTLDADLLFHFQTGFRDYFSAIIHNPLFLVLILFVLIAFVVLVLKTGLLRFIPLMLKRRTWQTPFSSQRALILSLIFHALVYTGGLIVLSSNILFLPSDWSRYITPIYPIFAVIWTALFFAFVSRIGLKSSKTFIIAVGTLMGIVLWVIPYSIMIKNLISQTSNGLSWTFTAEKWRSSPSIHHLRNILSKEDIIYSDNEYAVSVLLERSARAVPVSNDMTQIARWLDQPQKNGVKKYVIVFKETLVHHPPSNEPPYWPVPILYEDMVRIALNRSDVHLITNNSDAAIFRLGN